MDFLTIALIVAVALWVGWHLRGITLLSRFGSDPQHFIDILEKIKEINQLEAEGKLVTDGTELSVERVGNVLYAYSKDSGQFIAQGPDLTTLLNEAHARFPDRKFFGEIKVDNPAKEIAIKP